MWFLGLLVTVHALSVDCTAVPHEHEVDKRGDLCAVTVPRALSWHQRSDRLHRSRLAPDTWSRSISKEYQVNLAYRRKSELLSYIILSTPLFVPLRQPCQPSQKPRAAVAGPCARSRPLSAHFWPRGMAPRTVAGPCRPVARGMRDRSRRFISRNSNRKSSSVPQKRKSIEHQPEAQFLNAQQAPPKRPIDGVKVRNVKRHD